MLEYLYRHHRHLVLRSTSAGMLLRRVNTKPTDRHQKRHKEVSQRALPPGSRSPPDPGRRCQASGEATVSTISRSRTTSEPPNLGRVRTFCTVSRRPAGPHAPPTRRVRLRSRWRSRYGDANAGRLARKGEDFRAALTYSSYRGTAEGVMLPLPKLSGAGQNPSRPSVTAGQPHPSIAWCTYTRRPP